MNFLKKYAKYPILILLIIAIGWGLWSHFSIAALERRNKNLIATNDRLSVEMAAKKTEWELRFYALEQKTIKLQATIVELSRQHKNLLAQNDELQKKLIAIKIPERREDRVATLRDKGFNAEAVSPPAAPQNDGVCFDWPSSDKVLQAVLELEVVREINANLKETVSILEKKVAVQEDVILNTEAEVRAAIERAEFAENMLLAKDRVIAEQREISDAAIKKAKKSPVVWGAIGVGIGIVVGVVVTIFTLGAI